MEDLKEDPQGRNNPDSTVTSNQTLLTTTSPPETQMLATPTPPATASATEKNKSGGSTQGKGEKLSLAPGYAEPTHSRHMNNQRELTKSPRRSNNDSAQSSESRTSLSFFTRPSRQKEQREQGGNEVHPGAMAVHNHTTAPDLENSLVQAEVAPDMDAAIQRAVEDALRQRDEQMMAAAVVSTPEAAGTGGETNDHDEGSENGSKDHGEQNFNKMILAARVAIVVLIIVIVVLAVTLSRAGGDETSSDSIAAINTELPTRDPVLIDDLTGSPTPSPSSQNGVGNSLAPSAPRPTPTLPITLSGDCQSALIINPGFSQSVSTTVGLDSFVSSQCYIREGDRGVWLQFIPEFEAVATLRASEQNFSAKLAYFTGTCDFPVCGDRTTSGPTERILEFHAQVGKEYFLFVGGNGINNEGSLLLSLNTPSPPSSSYCAGAIDVTGSLPYDQQDSSVATVPTLTNEECRIGFDDRGNWYKYDSTSDVIITVILSSQERSTRMAYFTGSSCESSPCGDFSPGSVSTRTLVFHAKPGKSHYILVASNGFENVGNYRIRIIDSVPPGNSYFTGAENVIFDDNNPFVKEDTTQFAVPSFSSDECFVNEADRGLWYRYNPTVESITTVILSGSFDKRLSMYTGNCADNVCNSLSCVKGTGTSVGSDRVLEFDAKVGDDYFFLVSGSTFEDAGDFVIQFIASLEPPANSYCSNASTFTSSSGSDVESQEGNTAIAAPSVSSDSCLIEASNGQGLWYRYTPASDRMMQVILSEHEWIARLSYYSGNCNSLVCEFQGDALGADSISTLYAKKGVDYYLLASGSDSNEAGPFRISIHAPSPPTNSFCEGATEVSTVTLLGTTFADDTSTTVPSYSNPDCVIREQDRGIWYKLPSTAASPGGAVTVQVRGQGFDAKVSVFESQDSCSSLSCTIVSTTWGKYSSRSLTWIFTEGRTYYCWSFRATGCSKQEASLSSLSVDTVRLSVDTVRLHVPKVREVKLDGL